MTPQKSTAHLTARATDRCDRAIVAVAAGTRTVAKAWNQLRCWSPTLEQWQAFYRVAKAHGEQWHHKWPEHQHNCWTLKLDTGTYPEQRANWEAKQAAFEASMRARHPAAPISKVLTNAQRRAAARPAPAPCDHSQLALFT